MAAISGLDTALTPLRFLERSAAVFPEKTAIVDGPRRITYKEFAAQATRLAWALRRMGLEPGQTVGVMAPNGAEALLAHFAVPLAGGVLVAINTRLAAAEVDYICRHSEIGILLADDQLLGGVKETVAASGVVRTFVVLPDGDGGQPAAGPFGANTITFADLMAEGSSQPIPWSVEDEDSVITINYTSGTTGNPKGVMYTHRGAYLASMGNIATQGFDADSRYLWTLPMFHCNGWCTTWALTGAGGRHVCLRAVRGDDMWRLIDTENINRMAGAPAVLTTLVDDEGAHQVDDLRIVTAGAPPSPTIIERCESIGVDILHVYGLTETYGPYTSCEPQDAWVALDDNERAQLKSRQGVGMISAERVRVVMHQDVPGGSDVLVDVPADASTLGEIVMSGNNVMKGYFKDEAATAAAFAGGWFHSGDLGVMHSDGYVQLLDRAKDVVVSGGENISTVEVEAAIYTHPDVVDCAVIGMPDEKWGERPKAFVVLRSDSVLDADAIIEHCKTKIARYKVPGAVEITRALPRTSTGKVRKNELREREWAGYEKRIN